MTQNNNKPKIMVENVSCIIPQESTLGGLFVGNFYGAQNPTILKQYGIRAVLTLSIQTDIQYIYQDIPFHLRIEAHDKQNYNLRQHINACIHFIEQARKLTNVYVHCYAGVSRSIAIICAYIMWKFKWNYQTTIAFVKAKRVVAKPNDGFVKQLLQIQQILLETSYYKKPEIKKENQHLTFNQVTKFTEYNQNINPNMYEVNVQQNISNKININDNQAKLTLKQNPNLSRRQKFDQIQGNKLKNSQKPVYDKSSLSHNLTTNNPSKRQSNGIDKFANQYNIQSNKYHLNQHALPNGAFVNQQYSIKSSRQNQSYQINNKYQIQNQSFSTGNSRQVFNRQNPNKPLQRKEQPIINQSKSKQLLNKDNSKASLTQTSSISPYLVKKVSLNHMTEGMANPNVNRHINNQNQYHNYATSYTSRQNLNNNAQLKHNINQTNLNRPQSNQHIVLGGKKSPYNHNQIPIPKVSQRKQVPIINNNQKKDINSTGYGANNFIVQNVQTYSGNIRNGFNLTSPEKYAHLVNYDNSVKYSMKGYQSPRGQNVHNTKYDFRSTAPSQGFFKKENYNLQKQIQKSASRCLVKPKDLPGYKNYK